MTPWKIGEDIVINLEAASKFVFRDWGVSVYYPRGESYIIPLATPLLKKLFWEEILSMGDEPQPQSWSND